MVIQEDCCKSLVGSHTGNVGGFVVAIISATLKIQIRMTEQRLEGVPRVLLYSYPVIRFLPGRRARMWGGNRLTKLLSNRSWSTRNFYCSSFITRALGCLGLMIDWEFYGHYEVPLSLHRCYKKGPSQMRSSCKANSLLSIHSAIKRRFCSKRKQSEAG